MADKQTKLEEIAISQRESLIVKNTYNDTNIANNYSATHSRAKSDDVTPANGKGTGVAFDTANGGSYQDIYGVPNASGSGRIANILTNKYNEDNGYTTPDTTGNVGQVTI